ncbi:uncharacterized protein TM35_000192590 [Trypanosoma theileri]|uniref:Uncharacterized protein n=1 Tax=Trypanosoma theileri TaxID=67003 RepID=A0A1X0NTJ3_9TRYP|nr:uncharacterized protein TM35_000192590 [Trypanosoma theileri]ORC88015.1 hypothetical protein TM35_000192590 [Trypanosoma theileri]
MAPGRARHQGPTPPHPLGEQRGLTPPPFRKGERKNAGRIVFFFFFCAKKGGEIFAETGASSFAESFGDTAPNEDPVPAPKPEVEERRQRSLMAFCLIAAASGVSRVDFCGGQKKKEKKHSLQAFLFPLEKKKRIKLILMVFLFITAT